MTTDSSYNSKEPRREQQSTVAGLTVAYSNYRIEFADIGHIHDYRLVSRVVPPKDSC